MVPLCPPSHCQIYFAAELVIGLGALLVPSSVKRHPLMASSGFLCLAVLLWHLACYTATAVAAVAAAPKLAMSIGLLTFNQGSQAVLHLVAQIMVAMTLAASSRADLISNDPDRDDPAAPTAVEPIGPILTLHDSIANYWHHGQAQAQPSYQPTAAGASRSPGGDSAAESSALSMSEGGLTPIRTRVGQPPPVNQPPASLVCAATPQQLLLITPVSHCCFLCQIVSCHDLLCCQCVQMCLPPP